MSFEKAEILKLLDEGKTVGISLCQIIDGTPLAPITAGIADRSLNTPVTQNTLFEAASLTKPLFAMVVLKLAQEGEIDLDQEFGEMKDIAAIPEYQKLSKQDEYRKMLTARMILMHKTGLPNNDVTALQFFAKPGSQFKYSGYAYVLLQRIIEKQTGKTFAQLAQKVFDDLGMKHSHMMRPDNKPVAAHHNADMMKSLPTAPASPASAASGLYTTAGDYAIFIAAWIKESDKLLQSAFEFKEGNTLVSDQWAVKKAVPQADLEKLAWGMGWGLLKTEAGIIAFHWGDIGDSKAFVAMNVQTKQGLVYFANSWYGLSIANQLTSKGLCDLAPALNYLFKKFDYLDSAHLDNEQKTDIENFGLFELNNKPGWREKLKRNIATTITKYPEIFGDIQLDFSGNWEDKLKAQIATALAKHPNSGLETFMQMVLDTPLPQHMVEEDTSTKFEMK